MNYGNALEALKNGGRIARQGWNGKSMFLFLVPGSVDGSSKFHPDFDGISADLFEAGDTGTVTRLPCIGMKTASGALLHGWLASQTDMLANDWVVL